MVIERLVDGRLFLVVRDMVRRTECSGTVFQLWQREFTHDPKNLKMLTS